MRKIVKEILLVGLGLLWVSGVAIAKEPLPPELKSVGITERIGGTVPLNLTFQDEDGQPVRFGSIVKPNKAIILNLVYFDCPMLCNLVLSGLTDGLKHLQGLPVGEKFEIVSVSMNPLDTPEKAREFKKKYMDLLGQKGAEAHWHFWVGQQDQITRLANSVGFKYAYNPQTKQYAHAAALFFLTPEAGIARYLYGTEFKPLNLRLALTESRQGKMISSVERVLLFCYNYDAHSRGYVLYATNIMKLGGIFTILILAIVFWRLKKKESQNNQITQEKDSSKEA